MKKLTLTAVALLFSAAPAVAAITGTVIDATGAPLPGVTVRAYAIETSRERGARLMGGTIDREPLAAAETSANGAFRIDKAGAPVVDLVATAAGREMITRATADGEDVVVMLRDLQPRKLRVVVNGKPVAGAIVSLSRAVAVRAANDGTFELPVRNARGVGLFHHDIAPSDVAINRTETDLKADSGMAITGRVVGAEDKPVAGATLVVNGLPLGKSADDGSYSIAHAPRSWRELYAITADRIGVAAHGSASAYTIKLRPAVKVTGTVRDDQSHATVSGMLLHLPFGDALTDTAGAFTISPALPGRYQVSGMHPLYSMGFGSTLTIRSDGAKEALAATPLPLLSGTVIDEEKKPVGGASIGREAMGFPADTPGTWTRRDGTFSFHGSAAGMMRTPFEVSKEGYVDTEFSAGDRAKSGISVVLHRGVPAVVRVIDTEKAPVAGSLVRIAPAERGPGMQRDMRCGGGDCTTGADGTVSVNVQPGKYDISVWSPTAVTKQLPARMIDARSGNITVTVERGVEVSGRVTYSDGTPIDRSVFVQLESAGMIPMNNPTEPGGTFVFHNAPRGAVTLRPQTFDMPRFTGAPKEVTSPAANVVLTMPRGGRISGRVVDASSGRPITDFEVLATRNAMAFAGGAPHPVHADDGTFTLENISPGRFEITASAEGYSRGSANGIDVTEGGNVANVEVRLERAARVTGRVTSSDGQPLSGVRVAAMDSTRRMGGPAAAAMTDADGNYDLASVAPGERNITFSKDGFVAATKTVEATVNREAHLDATLDRGRDLTGRVVDDAGQAVAGAEVRLEGEAIRPVQSDTDGTFRLEGLREGHLRVFAHKNGYTDARQEAETSSSAPVTLTLGHGATLNGHIVGLSDAELAMTMVTYFGNLTYGSTRPDAAGNFSLTGVGDGKVTVEANTGSQPRRSARKVVEVANGSAPAVDLTFTGGNTVKGHVVAGNRSLSDYMVNFSSTDPSQPPGSARVDSDGSYAVSGLGTGDYRITVMAPMMGVLASEKLTVSGDAVHDIELHTLTLHGRITDTDGTPVSEARVVAEPVNRVPGSPMPRAGTTDSEGHYFLDFLSDASWRVSVQKEKYQPATKETTVSEGMPDFDIQLAPATRSTVRVVDARDGTPVLANVNAMQNNRTVYSALTRASDGVAELYLAPGHYTIGVNAPHYAHAGSQIDVPGSEVRVAIGHGGSVTVIAPAGAHVRLSGPNGMSIASGNNHFENVPAGTYTAKLLGDDGKATASKTFEVAEGQTVTVTVP